MEAGGVEFCVPASLSPACSVGQASWWQGAGPYGPPWSSLTPGGARNSHGPCVILPSRLKQTLLRTELSEAFQPVGPLSQQQAFRGASGMSECT